MKKNTNTNTLLESMYDSYYWKSLESPVDMDMHAAYFAAVEAIPIGIDVEAMQITRSWQKDAPIEKTIEAILDNNAPLRDKIFDSKLFKRNTGIKNAPLIRKFDKLGEPYNLKRSCFLTLYAMLQLKDEGRPICVEAISEVTGYGVRNCQIHISRLCNNKYAVLAGWGRKKRKLFEITEHGETTYREVLQKCEEIDWNKF